MSSPHPLEAAAAVVDGNTTAAGITRTFLEALKAYAAVGFGATEDITDVSFATGSPPNIIGYAQTGGVYFYNSDDTTTPHDGLTCLVTADGRRYILADASAMVFSEILDILDDPPGSPSDGDAYIVDAAPSGDWVGHAKDIALATPRGWVFATPKVGCALLNAATGLNIQYSVAGVWGAMATALDVAAVLPELMEFPAGLSVEAQQNAPPVSITAGLFYIVGTSPSGAWSGHANDIAVSRDGSSWLFIDAYDGAKVFNKATATYLTWFDSAGAWKAPWPYQATCQGRLTTESGVPVSTSDRTAQATLYFTPYRGNVIALYENGDWVLRTFSEISLSLAGYTSGKPFDIFAYDNAGTVTLESLVWTDDVTRATAIAYQDGIPVKSGDATRRLIGTIYTTGTGQIEDSVANRYVANLYNQTRRPMRRFETASTWTYNSTALRQANNSASNQLSWISVLGGEMVRCLLKAYFSGGGANLINAIGLDSVSAMATGVQTAQSETNGWPGNALELLTAVGAGRHRLTWLEQLSANTSTTIHGTNGDATSKQSGLIGEVLL